MFAKLIEIALKSALENPDVKNRIRTKIGQENKKNKIIDLNKDNYKVLT